VTLQALPLLDGSLASTIAWLYLVTNAARIVTYLPQILAVWRCRDGARAVSLLTWGSWVLSHVTALCYGVLVMRDGFFTTISTVNLLGCAAVTLIAAHRRRCWQRQRLAGF
jgi:uncharacterized protein with PQ loop repeat